MPDKISVVQELLEKSEDYKQSGSGSRKGKRPNIEQDYEALPSRLHQQYLSATPTYDAELFHHRYRVYHAIYDRIIDSVVALGDYFVQKPNCCGKAGISPQFKVTAALRILAYGLPPDTVENYVEISEKTARKTVKRISAAVIA